MMQQYLLVPPEQIPAAKGLGLPMGCLAAALGAEGRIHALSLPQGPLEGFLVAGVTHSPQGSPPPQKAVGDLLALCQRHGFRGVMLDIETPPTPYLASLIRLLEGNLGKRTLFLPESYANYSQRACICVSTALSGGSLEHRIKKALADYGPERLVLSFDRVCEDFYLPAPEGKGRPLSQEELEERKRRLEPRIFFSPALCAHYFTYMSRETGAHFILFDDDASMERKKALAEGLGVRRGIFVFDHSAL